MKISRYLVTLIIIFNCQFLIVNSVSAQTINSAYFTKDMKMRHTLNPAYGNDQGYFAMPVLGNITVNTHGNFGVKAVMFDNPMYGKGSDKKTTTFMNPYIDDATALGEFAKGNNRIVGDVNIAILSMGFRGFGGYNTIEINARTNVGVSLPYELLEFARNTGNKTYDIGDINVHAQAFAELAFGHSRDINERLRVGAKMKFLFGAGRADVTMKNVKADLAAPNKWIVSGQAEGYLSLKGAEITSKTKEYNQPQPDGRTTYETIDEIKVKKGGIGGFGVGFDLGAVYKYNDNWTFSAALLDLGFIRWSNSLYVKNATDQVEFEGFHDISVSESRDPNTLKYQADSYGDQLKDFANLQDQGDKGGRTTGIGATMNFGAEYTLPKYERLSFGLLSSTKLNGKYSWTEARLSANWTPVKWLDGGVSFALNSFTTSMGWILNIHPKGYNLFLGMDHILGKTSKEWIPLSSNASLSLGMSFTW